MAGSWMNGADYRARYKPILIHPEEALRLEREARQDSLPRLIGRLPPPGGELTAPELSRLVRHHRLAKTAMRWQPGGGNLLIVGPVDIGKTALALLLMRIWLVRSASTGKFWPSMERYVWTTGRELEDEARETPLGMTPYGIRRAEEAAILVIDDVGRGKHVEAIKRVMEARYLAGRRRQRQTIITSSLTLLELQERYSEDTYKRFLLNRGQLGIVADGFEMK